MVTNMKRMLEDYYASWSSRDVERIASFFTDDMVYEDVPLEEVRHDKADYKAGWDAFFTACLDFNLQLKTLFVAGDRAGSEWIMTGTPRVHLPGLGSAGESFSVRGASILELQEGKIRRNADYWHLMRPDSPTGANRFDA